MIEKNPSKLSYDRTVNCCMIKENKNSRLLYCRKK